MEDIPPSYSQSINPSVLDILAPYLDTLSLHALTLVSRSYNAVFMPYLWGSPASHFVPMDGLAMPGDPENLRTNGSYDDLVYVALTRFKRVLKRARPSTRQLVHTLFLPPALSEIYGGPNATWLREILDGLPNLQSLCVGGLPFFDHHSLVAVDKSRTSQTEDDDFYTHPLKLLIASREPNCTSTGLSLFIPHMTSLVYLDLSYTTPARDANVLATLAALSDLQILKLRGIGMRDVEAEVLANAIRLRVRLLDVADNLLSDMAIRSLLQACVQHKLDEAVDQSGSSGVGPERASQRSRRQLESWPVSLPPAPDFLSLDILRSSEFDKRLRLQLTNPLTGRLAFEDIPHAGLTHLYVTGNPAITIEGVRSLLHIGRLHVLDAGEIVGETLVDKYVRSAIDTGRWHDRPTSARSAVSPEGNIDTGPSRRSFDKDIHFPGAEKLIPVLRQKASTNLTYLRIDHAIITKESDTKMIEKAQAEAGFVRPGPSSPVELSGQIGVTQKVEIPGDRYFAAELPAEQVFELDGNPTVRAELPGDLIHFAVSPPVNVKPADNQSSEESSGPIRGVGPFAPEVVHEERRHDVEAGDTVVLSATGFVARRPDSSHSPISPMTPVRPSLNMDAIVDTPPPPSVPSQPSTLSSQPVADTQSSDRRKRIESLLRERPSSNAPFLHPSSLPNLRTLKLTNVPSQVAAGSPIIKSLERFITFCAAEAQLALLRARTDYSLPPGQARAAAEREHARSLFALQTIVLEIVPATSEGTKQRDWKHARQRQNAFKSSTGDIDSEALWSAAANDFSFFGEEGEEHDECGIYDHEPGKYFPKTTVDEKFAVFDDTSPSGSGGGGVGGTGWSSGSENARTMLTGPSVGTNANANANVNTNSGTVFQSPLQLPLGRNRRSSAERTRQPGSSVACRTLASGQRFSTTELPGTIPTISSSSSGSRPGSAITQTVAGPNNPSLFSPSSVSPSQPQPQPQPPPRQPVVMVDTVAELSKFRKSRKAAYDQEIRNRARINGVTDPVLLASLTTDTFSNTRSEIYVAGHWKGKIEVDRTALSSSGGSGSGGGGGSGEVRSTGRRHQTSISDGSRGRMQRTGDVDIYGNYFEKGYLYS